MTYQLLIEDDGQLVDTLPVCSRGCARDVAHVEALEDDKPLPYEPEFDTWCLGCGVIMGGHASALEDGTEDCRHRYPIVVNRLWVETAEVCEHGVTIQQPISLTIWEGAI